MYCINIIIIIDNSYIRLPSFDESKIKKCINFVILLCANNYNNYVIADADTICKDTNDDGTMELESSLTTLKDNIISVIEGDMFDVIDQDDNNSIDGTYSLESCNTPFSRLEHTKKRRKSVCHLHLLHSTSTGTTGTSKRGKSNEKDSTDYWRPKLLRKMHKIKLQVCAYIVLLR